MHVLKKAQKYGLNVESQQPEAPLSLICIGREINYS